MIKTSEYLDITLARYAGSFDITKEAEINGRIYPAFGRFTSMGEKYVLSKKARLWAFEAFEYILFLEEEECTLELLEQIRKTMIEHMEPEYVRAHKKYPDENHMYSYLTAAIICEKKPTEEVLRAIKKFKFDKGYLFSMRGHTEAHLVVADMETEGVYVNGAGRALKKIFLSNFEQVKKGAKGYNELYIGV